MQKNNNVKVYVHPQIAYFEISPKKGLTIKDIIRELESNFSIDLLSKRLPFTIIINHSKVVNIEEEVKEGDRVDIHLAVVAGG